MSLRIGLGLGLVLSLVIAERGPAAPPPAQLAPKTLAEQLAAKPKGAAAERLANQVRGWFGKANLAKGPFPKVDGLSVAWAIEVPGLSAKAQTAEGSSPVRVVSDDGKFVLPLVPIGQTDVFAAATTLPEGSGMRWVYEVEGKRQLMDLGKRGKGPGEIEVYTDHPETLPRSDVPKGKLTQPAAWKSEIFKGTTRDWWVYVPAQYKGEPACVMVFQDGQGYKDVVATTFDNLIAKGDMPVTVGVFIQPGTFADKRSNRSFEYDTLSDQYARFLLEEILPEVEKTVKLRHDPESRAVAGISSGGICAWTVAWERPNEFRKVLSWVGSFTNIASGKTLREGGHNYEALIRKTTPTKPIRVFLQDGSRDLDNNNGNWPLANQQMAKALESAGYDYKFVFGEGFHSNKHGRAILPDSLRWLWRDAAAK